MPPISETEAQLMWAKHYGHSFPEDGSGDCANCGYPLHQVATEPCPA